MPFEIENRKLACAIAGQHIALFLALHIDRLGGATGIGCGLVEDLDGGGAETTRALAIDLRRAREQAYVRIYTSLTPSGCLSLPWFLNNALAASHSPGNTRRSRA